MKLKKMLTLGLIMISLSLSAQTYTHSIGAVAGMLNGVSYKGFLTDHVVMQADLGFGIDFAPIGRGYVVDCWDFRINPNAAYQWNIADNFGVFAGGGLSLGEVNSYRWNHCIGGVFGINAIAGCEYVFSNVPICIGLDFRPGYGLFFDSGSAISSFDWHLDIAVRYCF